MEKMRRLFAGVLLSVGLVLPACGGHVARTADVRSALDVMQPERALEAINEQLDADTAEELPEALDGDQPLLLLDRAMVLMQLDRYQLASRDLQVADKSIEFLDFSRNAVDDLGKYLFSDASGPYKAPAYEKLFINTMNMLSYLVRGELQGARIEARRLAVMQKFIRDHEDPAQSLLGPGSYFAGFVFEKSGQPQEALRYYDEALAYGSYRSLVEPVRRLSQQASYRSPRLREVIGDETAEPKSVSPSSGEPSEPETESARTRSDDDGELLVVVNFGRVPPKLAKRIPIGLALTYASGALSPHSQAQANKLAAQGLVTWVNYPELGKPRGTYEQPTLHVERRRQPLEGLVAVDKESKRAWKEVQGSVVASAITRMVARVVAGQAVQKAAGDDLVGILLNLGTQATMTALDTPDTRCWSTLPARMAVGRIRMKPGVYEVTLRAGGWQKTHQVKIEPRGWKVVALTTLA
ncbi:hypothetical protein ACFL5O_02275 [Myxococcota bacterium]